MELNHIKPLDGLRTIAIFLVLFWHYIANGLSEEIPIIKEFAWWTWSGVDLFFVLSGFLIGRILIYNKGSQNYFKAFYVRRVLRIFPAYYLVLVAFIIFLNLGLSAHYPNLTDNPIPFYAYFFYIQNFWMSHYSDFGATWLNVTWSLSIEEQFYLLLPLCIFLISKKNLPKILITGILLAPVYRALFSQGLTPYVLLPARMDSLLIGVLIAYYYLNGKLESVFKGKQKVLLISFVTCFVLQFICGAGKPMVGIGGVYIHSALMLMYAILLVFVLVSETQSIFIRFLSTPVMSFFAKISYMMYLTHILIIELLNGSILYYLKPDNVNKVALISFAFIITILVYTISYYVFEKPILGLGKRFKY
jgi:peptidoglycan/LPS O-acetylase OafA/YrhL